MFINYAHRGASAYAPENTMSAFLLGIKQGANGIETDVRRTKDGVLVLFHDDNMEPLTGLNSTIESLNYDQLSSIKIRFQSNDLVFDYVPKLIDLIDLAKKNNVYLALEIKGDGIEKDVLDIIESSGYKDYCTVTSFVYKHISTVKKICPKQRVSLLTYSIEDAIIYSLLKIGAEEISPIIDILNKDAVFYLKKQGLSVRPWGISNCDKMEKAYSYGVNGMTVNFPDRLYDLIRRKEDEYNV